METFQQIVEKAIDYSIESNTETIKELSTINKDDEDIEYYEEQLSYSKKLKKLAKKNGSELEEHKDGVNQVLSDYVLFQESLLENTRHTIENAGFDSNY